MVFTQKQRTLNKNIIPDRSSSGVISKAFRSFFYALKSGNVFSYEYIVEDKDLRTSDIVKKGICVVLK
ncbi:hypothetical protein COI41_22255 [Bacillus toyonensis]|uniref:hypothetical protein n=1 Tax=Bacillus toyonensis TaxID=155322 RepID=UPI000BF397C1|nr:hypothetical protein [Bacillus toyonensis]PEW28496.1 hypothetical protein CN427_11740 [Bacillus thuringiensis]PHF52268.1 hypothetical protein COI41_22255 [Bacillus toyonensis]